MLPCWLGLVFGSLPFAKSAAIIPEEIRPHLTGAAGLDCGIADMIRVWFGDKRNYGVCLVGGERKVFE